MSGMRVNLIMGVLVLLLIFLQYRLWFQPGGIHEMMTIRQRLAEQAVVNDKLKKRNEELLLQVKRLQNSHDAVESRARNELGMIKKDETFYQIVKQ